MSSYWTKRRKIKHDIDQSLRNIVESSESIAGSSESCDIVGTYEGQVLASLQPIQKTTSTVYTDAGAETDEFVNNCDASSSAISKIDHNSVCFKIDNEFAAESSYNSKTELDFVEVNNGMDSFEDLFEIASRSFSDDEDEMIETNILQSFSQQHGEELQDKLADWKGKNPSVTNSALSNLLKTLQPYFPTLPKDARTLLKTLSSAQTAENTQKLSGGEYYHFGIKDGVRQHLDKRTDCLITPTCNIVIQCNTDGLPLFKSASDQFWPILGLISKPFHSTPFIIGLYYGKEKPSNLDYLKPFVQEYIFLRDSETFHYKNSIICVKIQVFICDAPARAMIKNIRYHSGYHSCERCTQKGKWRGKMTFPKSNAPLRTDYAFRQMSDKPHHHGLSPLLETEMNLVSDMVLDYMHLVCLGVVRRLIMLWLWGTPKCRQSRSMIFAIPGHLIQLKSSTPAEFARKPRSLMEVKRWKATEFRQFLLYTGPVVLRGKLPMPLYKNFMLLSVAIRILLHETMCKEYNHYAKDLLHKFVKHFAKVYGPDMVVYNVHNLIHLPDDAMRHGSLQGISAFPFENFMSSLLKLIKKPSQPLQQVIRRLSEKTQFPCANNIDATDLPLLSVSHESGPLPSSFVHCTQYKKVTLKNFVVGINSKDNCVFLDNNVVLVCNILKTESSDIVLVYQKFSQKTDFFYYPTTSGMFDMYEVANLEPVFFYAPLIQIKGKAFLMPYKNKFVAMSLVHCI